MWCCVLYKNGGAGLIILQYYFILVWCYIKNVFMHYHMGFPKKIHPFGRLTRLRSVH